MKNLILLLTVTLLSYNGISQTTFTVNNFTGETLTDIGLILTNQANPCTPTSVNMFFDLPDGSSDFVTVPGFSQFIYVIGAAGASGNGHRYYSGCAADDLTPYIFVFDDWNVVSIY